MLIQIRHELAGVDWAAVAQVLEKAPLTQRDPEKLRRASENSFAVALAYHGDQVVGFGRAISDGEFFAALYEIAVLPEYQGQGIGQQLVEALLTRLPVGSIILYAFPGREGFYEQFGFSRLKTAMGKFDDMEQKRANGYVE